MPDKFCNRMSAKTKRAQRRNRYLKSRDSASLYMKEYCESNKSAIRDSQKQYYEQNKDITRNVLCKHKWQASEPSYSLSQ